MELPDFSAFPGLDGKIWLNCAHQGPLPAVAAEAARRAIEWKEQPWELTTERFSGVPARLRETLGRLLRVPGEDVVLGNSASFGLHLLANGLPFRSGDEVLVMDGDFPSNLLPWEGRAGVTVRRLQPAADVLTADEVQRGLTPASRAVCLSWVHSFSGRVADLRAIAWICRERGVWLLVNGSQAVGARPFDPESLPVDALVGVGFKWLCGPYGTGYCWIRPELRERMAYNQRYWLSLQTAEALERGRGELAPPADWGARRYDLFGTANFFNFTAWTAALDRLLAHGVETIERHDQQLVARLLARIDRDAYRVLTPEDPERRSTLVFLTHREPARNRAIFRRLAQRGIHLALRAGALRAAPHYYNSVDQIDELCNALAEVAG